MTESVVVARPGAFAQIRIQEPAGERTLDPPMSIGGVGADVVVPGIEDGPALRIDRREGVWVAQTESAQAVRFDGRPMRESRDLRRGDVMAVGDAQVIVLDASRTLLRLDVIHLVGNDTIAPVGIVSALAADGDETGDDIEIKVIPAAPLVQTSTSSDTGDRKIERDTARSGGARRRWPWIVGLSLVALLLIGTIIATFLEPVALDIQPNTADVSTPGTWISFQTGNRLQMLPGTHRVRAELKGYAPSETIVVVKEDGKATAKLSLNKLPGQLNIDTSGVAATVSVNGVEVGKAPGVVEAPAGSQTITLRAPRYLDFVTTLDVKGAGERQDVKAQLQPSWGTLQIAAIPTNAQVSVDGKDQGVAPASLELDAGVRAITLSAPGLKNWESNVVIKAGETQKIGPIQLGQPDAKLTVRSVPAGADVTVAGQFRGKTPTTVELPSGVSHDVVVGLPGYTLFTQSVFADAGKSLAIDAKLNAILGGVSIQGDPADADVLIDGKASGKTPRKLNLTAIQHRVEVRKQGFEPFTATVLPAKGLERAVQYKLTPSDRAAALMESAPTVTSKTGYLLQLIPRGTFIMGSDRREQGRRPNEVLRQVKLERPFYLGANEVTNLLFKKFKPDHVSGYMEKRSFDLDTQPVTKVTWDMAVEFCNWLSEQDGLPATYERKGGAWELKKPATTGYRLPTEAEWEYAARYAGPSRTRRFAWGDELPIAPAIGNLAGTEGAKSLPTVLETYKDDFVGVAPVGKFQPNALGLYDMTGNVTEWTNDYYLSFQSNEAVTDPLGPENSSRRVIRGANWMSAAVAELRLAWRDGANESSQTIGFRVARYAE
jgi:formylglycine-generating enzyme required for sulfatase activity